MIVPSPATPILDSVNVFRIKISLFPCNRHPVKEVLA